LGHHTGLAAVSSYLGAPGSSPAERMREDAELELGVPSERKNAVSESEVSGGRYWVEAQRSQEKMPSWSSAFPARKKMLCLSPRFSKEDTRSKPSVPKRRGVDAKTGLLIDPLNGYSERSYHHPGLTAVSFYLGAPGSSPAERMSEDAELELGVPSEGKDAVSESEFFGERYRVEMRHSQPGRGVDAKTGLLIDSINVHSERSYPHPKLAAVSSYPGAPGSSPAERGSEEAELELGVNSTHNLLFITLCLPIPKNIIQRDAIAVAI